MGFHLRKTKKIGMFNLNLSNSGIGTSFGVKGFRIGVDGKGRSYIAGGKGMFRFREYLDTKPKKNKSIEKYEPEVYQTVNNEIYSPNLFNSWSFKGFKGFINVVLKAIACIVLSLIAFLIFGSIVMAIGEKHSGIGLLIFLIFGIGTMLAPWQHIYKPKFVKLAQEGLKLFNKQNYEQAEVIFEQSQNEINNTKYYESTYKFDKWLHDCMYICYIKLEQKEKAINLLENTIIISDKDERILELYEQLEQFDKMLKYIEESNIAGKREKKVQVLHKLERWNEVINVLQKEYSQEEKDEHPSVYGVLAEAFLKLNQPQTAIDCLLQGPINVRKMSADMCAFRYALGECYEAIGDVENAKKQYSKIYAYDMNFEDVAEKMQRLN